MNVEWTNDTIAAISTAPGKAGIGIVRISGKDAFAVADRVYRGKKGKVLSAQESHTVHYGYIVDEGETIDQVLVILLKGPRSYTGEDTVEIDCHGGSFVTRRILDTVIRHGARPAEPGEFSKRAFLNGRMDLSQAEAVIDLIEAKNEYALKSSVRQLKGSVKKKINDLRNKIIYHTAYIESALDDPEHIDLDGYAQELDGALQEIMGEVQRLLDTADDGRMLREGIRTAIVGKPNAGKSTLLNALLGMERAIVTDIAGTTRDVLEESLQLGGITLQIMDTAGIRTTADIVEQIGVDRARSSVEEADLVLYVADSSLPLDENDREIMELIRDKKAIVLVNKTDLDAALDLSELRDSLKKPLLTISAKEETGIEELEELIREMFYQGEISFNDEVYITNARQKAALSDARESLERVRQSIADGMPEDFFTIDLMDAYESLGRITGESIGDDLADEIFSKFCMGK